MVNGHVYPEVDEAKLGATFRERRFLYLNQGKGKFKDVSAASGPGMMTPLSGRGLAVADLWNDGRMSAVVNNLSDVPLLLVNEAKNANHWLGVRLVGKTTNADGIGAKVTVVGASRKWVDEVRSGSSYNSSSDLRVHFGLETGDEGRGGGGAVGGRADGAFCSDGGGPGGDVDGGRQELKVDGFSSAGTGRTETTE